MLTPERLYFFFETRNNEGEGETENNKMMDLRV